MLPTYYSNLQRKKIADHSDFRLIGTRQDTLYRLAQTAQVSHDQCTQQMQSLTSTIGDLKQQLSDAISSRQDIKTSFNGFPPMINPAIFDSGDQLWNLRQLSYINSNLQYRLLKQNDRLRGAFMRDTVEDRSNLLPQSPDQQILVLQQQIWEEQNRLVHWYKEAKEVGDMRVAEEDNEWMKSRVLAEVAVQDAKGQDHKMKINTSYHALRQSKAEMENTLAQKEKRLTKLQSQAAMERDPTELNNENQQLMQQIARLQGEERVQLIQKYAYLTVLYEQLQQQQRAKRQSQQISQTLSQRQSLAQQHPPPQQTTEQTLISHQTVEQSPAQQPSDHQKSQSDTEPIFSNRPVLVNEILDRRRYVIECKEQDQRIQEQQYQTNQQGGLSRPPQGGSARPVQQVQQVQQTRTQTTMVQVRRPPIQQPVAPSPGCDPYYLLPG